MGFITIEGFPGKIFVPEEQPADSKKFPCRDCFSCQFCDDDRCLKCLSLKRQRPPKPDPDPE